MKSVVKLLTSSFLLLGLVACGGEEEIVYEESPHDILAVYTLMSGDTAPAYYSNILAYTAETATVEAQIAGDTGEEEEEEPEEDIDLDNLAVPVPLSKDEEKALEKAQKELDKLLEEEQKRLDAATEILQAERDREYAKIDSIRVIGMQDNSESYTEQVQEAKDAYLELYGGGDDAITATITEKLTAKEEAGEELPYMTGIETPVFTYTYDVTTTGKTGSQVTGDYVSYMQSSGFKIIDAFHPVNNEYYEMLTPDFTQRAGTVALGKKASGTEKIFMILVDWYTTGATVTVYEEDGTLWIAPKKDTATKSSLSINDVVSFFETRTPSQLGLEGSSMDEYSVYTFEGIVMINGVSYRQFNITRNAGIDGTGAGYGGNYLVDGDGNTFLIDKVTGTVSPLKLTNVFDTLN